MQGQKKADKMEEKVLCKKEEAVVDLDDFLAGSDGKRHCGIKLSH